MKSVFVCFFLYVVFAQAYAQASTTTATPVDGDGTGVTVFWYDAPNNCHRDHISSSYTYEYSICTKHHGTMSAIVYDLDPTRNIVLFNHWFNSSVCNNDPDHVWQVDIGRCALAQWGGNLPETYMVLRSSIGPSPCSSSAAGRLKPFWGVIQSFIF